MTGRRARPTSTDPQELARSPLAPVIAAVAFVLVGLKLLFGTTYLVGLSMLRLSLAPGALLGQLLGEYQVAGVQPRTRVDGPAQTKAGSPA